MKKEKKIKINYITYINKHYVPTTYNLRMWINISKIKDLLTQVNLIFVGSKRMRTLNKKYLKKDKPTNVLTFTYENIGSVVGDIVLCPEIINQEAKEYGFSSNLRWAHMIVHSMLHLQGYDHHTKNEQVNMESMEIKLLTNMNFENPYVRN